VDNERFGRKKAESCYILPEGKRKGEKDNCSSLTKKAAALSECAQEKKRGQQSASIFGEVVAILNSQKGKGGGRRILLIMCPAEKRKNSSPFLPAGEKKKSVHVFENKKKNNRSQ